MSGNYSDDNHFSDQCISSSCLKEHIIDSCLFGLEYNYDDRSQTKLDTDNNIDGFINDIPVQMHMQRIENVKGCLDNYHAYTKFRRNKTNAKTELLKIIQNKKNGEPYPKYIIWGVVDPEKNLLYKIEIIDTDTMLYNHKKNKKAYKKDKNIKQIDYGFYKNSKYYKTFYNPMDGTEPLFLKSETPLYKYKFDDECLI